MAQHRVVVCCWLRGHQTELFMTVKQEEGLVDKIDKLKAVCPVCRNDGMGNQPIFIYQGKTVFTQPKIYECERGHVSTVLTLGTNTLHVRFGIDREEFINVEGTLSELPELIDSRDISCHHVIEGQCCDFRLSPIDDFMPSYPVASNIKTRTRLGDLFDRAGVEPVRPGSYDGQGNYNATKTEQSNRERLKRMRDRNIPVERLPGKRIDKPTDTTYGRRSKRDINPDRLTGPK